MTTPKTEPKKRAGRPKLTDAQKAAAKKAAEAADAALASAALSFEPAKMPKRSNTVDNVFTKPLTDSYEKETAVATRVPAVSLRRVEGLLRRAAAELKIGVSIAVESDAKGEPIVAEDGTVALTFMGKDRRKRKTDEEPETPAETSEGTELSADGESGPSTDTAGESEPAPAEREPAGVAP